MWLWLRRGWGWKLWAELSWRLWWVGRRPEKIEFWDRREDGELLLLLVPPGPAAASTGTYPVVGVGVFVKHFLQDV